MARSRFDNLPEQTRHKLLETAAGEFAARGYEGASLNAILRQAGFSKGAAYYYFENKADLFATVVRHHFERLLGDTRLEDILTAFDGLPRDRFWPAFERLVADWVNKDIQTARTLAQLRLAWMQSEEARRYIPCSPYADLPKRFATALIETGQKVGAVRRDLPTDLLVHLYLAIDTALDEYLAHHELDAEEIKRLAKKLTPMLRQMLQPAGKSS